MTDEELEERCEAYNYIQQRVSELRPAIDKWLEPWLGIRLSGMTATQLEEFLAGRPDPGPDGVFLLEGEGIVLCMGTLRHTKEDLAVTQRKYPVVSLRSGAIVQCPIPALRMGITLEEVREAMAKADALFAQGTALVAPYRCLIGNYTVRCA